MIDIENIRSAYFLGIGGIGMSAVARYFHSRGIRVAGYDKTPSPLTKQLTAEGMAIHYEDNPSLIPEESDIGVYTPAVPKTLKEYQYLNERNIPIMKRSQVLGIITSSHYTIAVAGTHGKTSVTALIAHTLHQAGLKVTAFVGGILKNYHSNCLISDSTNVVVVEADEYDRSFLNLTPDMAVITAIDPDHLDIYGNRKELESSFRKFAGLLRGNGKLIIEKSLRKHFTDNGNLLTYGLETGADYLCNNAIITKGYQHFTLSASSVKLENIRFQLPGSYNQKNAAAAFAVATLLGAKLSLLKDAFESFEGVERRFDIQLRTSNVVYIDDYAHHPSELDACIGAIRTLFPGKKITGIFQPHLYSRTRDFADGFAESLDKLDDAILIPVYPAREEPIKGISSEMILERMHSESKHLFDKNDLPHRLNNFKIDVLVTLGAGDIDRLVVPIKNWLTKIYE